MKAFHPRNWDVVAWGIAIMTAILVALISYIVLVEPQRDAGGELLDSPLRPRAGRLRPAEPAVASARGADP